ncbi:hypothetical protein H257_19013, partial [Aphanomyces astaci]
MPSSRCESIGPTQSRVKAQNLTDVERQAMINMLLASSNGGKRKYGSVKGVADQFNCHRTTVSAVWNSWKASCAEGGSKMIASPPTSRMKGNCGAKMKWSAEAIEAAIKSVPFHKRQTTRALAFHSGVPRSTILRHMKRNRRLRCKSSYLRPLLTEDNKEERMKRTTFSTTLHDVVHVDEKWFFLTKNKGKFYVYDDETLPHRQSKSKRFITKLMFLCAVARPRYDVSIRRMFNGKIGMWPFVVKAPAQRNSKNRPRGTMLTEPQNVTAQVYQDMLLTRVIPAIKMKLPLVMKSSTVYIQQDNAGPHAKSVNKAIDQLVVNDGWTIRLRNQPPN